VVDPKYTISTALMSWDLDQESLTLEIDEKLCTDEPIKVSFVRRPCTDGLTHNVFTMISFLSIRAIASRDIANPYRINIPRRTEYLEIL